MAIARPNGILDHTFDNALSLLLRDTSYKTAQSLSTSIVNLAPTKEEATLLGEKIANILNREINEKVLPQLYNRNPIAESTETLEDFSIALYNKIIESVPRTLRFNFELPVAGRQTITLDARTTFQLALPFAEFQKLFINFGEIKNGFAKSFESNLRAKVTNVAGLGFVAGVTIGSLFSLTMVYLIKSSNN